MREGLREGYRIRPMMREGQRMKRYPKQGKECAKHWKRISFVLKEPGELTVVFVVEGFVSGMPPYVEEGVFSFA